MRTLRRYEHIANKNHFCDRCCNYIMPGDQYEGLVQVDEKGLIVFKTHIHPSCDYPTDDEESRRSREFTVTEREPISSLESAA